MITLENYVMEQEINDTSVNDIAMEQAIAEFNVACALYDCYQKESAILEYTTGVSGEVYQEGEKLDKIKDNAKKAADGAKKVLKAGWEAVMRAIENFIGLFTKVNFSKLADKIDQYESDYEIPNFNYISLTKMTGVFKYTTKLAENMASDITDSRAYTQLWNEYKKYFDDTNATSSGYNDSINARDLASRLRKLETAGSGFKTGFHNLKKNTDFEGFLERNPDTSSATINIIKQFLKNLSDVYVEAGKALKKMISMIGDYGKIKSTKKKETTRNAKAAKNDPFFNYNAEDEASHSKGPEGDAFFGKGGDTNVSNGTEDEPDTEMPGI